MIITDHRSQITDHKAKRLIKGFTLIEMMVVIGIIAILSSVAIPGLRTLYRTYKTYEAYDQADTLIRTLTAYNLIMNTDYRSAPMNYKQALLEQFTPFLPSNSFDPTKYVPQTTNVRSLNWKIPDETNGWMSIGYRSFCLAQKYISGEYVTPYWWDGFVKRYTKQGCTFRNYANYLEVRLPYYGF